MNKAAAFRLLQRSLFRGEISSQPTALAAPPPLLHRRHYTFPWRAEEAPGTTQRRLFHGTIKQSGRPPALAQAALLHRRHHTTPWRGEVSAPPQGRLPRNSIKHYFSASARWVSYIWWLCKVAAAAACVNVMYSVVYHTYLVRVPYTSDTPYFRLETVPYTNRTHYVIRSPLDDREYGESCFSMFKRNYPSTFLSPLHPDSVRVNLITAQLLPAVQRGLDIKKRHAIESKKQGRSCGSQQPQVTHLDGLDWEVFVMKNDGHAGAVSWSNGKISVFTGLLNRLETDAEIAAILAHEIAHLVARHWSEAIIYKKWCPYPLKVYFVRRMEIEADRMGMLMMAAAGFDPRIVPVAVEKLVGNDIYHPSGKKRAQLLSRAKVMDEALELYREVMSAKAPEIHSATGA
ncbi:hypothetical protein VPH35_134787 [Triticum aestivum]|uniref:mitochondrial metalloendopeptidase OMA1 n=1 Tax=Triticum aestivum TaxID=4565 RepID=UPI0008424AD9|nr:mitochondrial metalloendopeptidase OMA1-like [Triticum aestivum]